MPKVRDYANEDTLKAALVKEGLHEAAVIVIEPSGESGRVKPVFLTTDEDLIKRLHEEGYDHRAPEPAPDVPEGFEAVKDEHGRFTGTIRPINPEGSVTLTGDATVTGAVDEPERVSPINPHVSDLFFNYGHDIYSQAVAAEDTELADTAIRDDAEEFAASVLGAFGIAVNAEELVADFYGRL